MDISKLNNLYPNFLVVGAAKSGTSSLHEYFRQHPQIFMPKLIKELNFFHLRGHEHKRAILKRIPYLPTNILSYLGFFYDKNPNKISGECSPSYLYYYKDTIKNIKEIHPNWQDLKIIIILREPIDKIWSHYKFAKMKRLDPEDLSLEKSLEIEEQRIINKNLLPDLFYIDNTSYYKQVKAFYDEFKNVKIIKYDDLKNQPNHVMKEVFSFLDCDSQIKIDTTRKHNVSKPILNYRNDFLKKTYTNLPLNLHRFIPSRVKNSIKVEEHMSQNVKVQLAKNFDQEIKKLQKLTGMDFRDWLKKYKNIIDDTN